MTTVTDLASAHVLALDALRSGGRSTVYNLGNGRPTSVKDVVDAVAHVTGKQVPWEAAPRREGDPAILFASSDRIKRDLGWRPQYEDVTALLPEFRKMEAEAGRSVPITVWGKPKEPDLVLRDRDLGVLRVVLHFDAAKADVVLPELDRWAALIPCLAG